MKAIKWEVYKDRVGERQGGQGQFSARRWSLQALIKDLDLLLKATRRFGEFAERPLREIIREVVSNSPMEDDGSLDQGTRYRIHKVIFIFLSTMVIIPWVL